MLPVVVLVAMAAMMVDIISRDEVRSKRQPTISTIPELIGRVLHPMTPQSVMSLAVKRVLSTAEGRLGQFSARFQIIELTGLKHLQERHTCRHSVILNEIEEGSNCTEQLVGYNKAFNAIMIKTCGKSPTYIYPATMHRVSKICYDVCEHAYDVTERKTAMLK